GHQGNHKGTAAAHQPKCRGRGFTMTRKSRVLRVRPVPVFAVLAGTLAVAGVLSTRGNSWSSVSATASAQGRGMSTEYLSAGNKGLFELRIYPLKQNLIANTYKFMNNVNTFQKQVGMNIIGHFPDLDSSKYIWMRNYPDHATLEQRYRATYDSE